VLSPRDHYYPQFEKFITDIAACRTILDLGTYYAFRKELAPFADKLRKTNYFTMGYRIRDIDPKERPPDVDGDICALPFGDASADAVICKDVLEHVVDPVAAVAEMHRALKRGGLLYCSVPFLHPYHGNRNLADYWRFTHEGLDVLFSDFSEKTVVRTGGAVFVVRAFTPPPLSKLLFSAPLMPLVNALDKLSLGRHATNMFLVFARK
jgi:SAM-dependent methyltransferase